MKRTALHAKHLDAAAKMVDFAGWEMPLHYGSQLHEHQQVRTAAGVFDVAHMCYLSISGDDATEYLRQLLCGDVKTLTNAQGLYSAMLTSSGGIIDDLIVYKLDPNNYKMVINAGTTAKVLKWLQERVKTKAVQITEHTDRSIIAVQGPQARDKLLTACPEYEEATKLRPFHFALLDETFIARTGYTGEDGYELVVLNSGVESVWDKLLAAGVAPAGLGSRDTLRLEAGYSLYGNELDEQHSPLASGLAWIVNWKDEGRNFSGKEALMKEQELGIQQKIKGLYITRPGVLRQGAKVVTSAGEGIITSGGFSPTLKHSIALARIPYDYSGEECEVELRGQQVPARLIKPPFVKQGQPSPAMLV